VLLKDFAGEELQRVSNPCLSLFTRDPTVLGANANRGEAKPVAARLAISRLGPFARPPSALARSSTKPVELSVCSQK